jgi:hypothetical protein
LRPLKTNKKRPASFPPPSLSAGSILLQSDPAPAQSSGMSTLTKPKPRPRTPSSTRAERASAAARAKITPPNAKTAREVMANYPAPSAAFDGDLVNSIIDARATR